MKRNFILLVIFLCSVLLLRTDPIVKFNLKDGSTKEINIKDIDHLNITRSKISSWITLSTKNNHRISIDASKINKILLDSNQITFIQSDTIVSYLFSDFQDITIDTNIKIGNKLWMKRNLDVDHYRNGDSIPEVRDSVKWENLKTGAWCYYNNDPAIGAVYGKLYNWYAVMDPRGLAPKGWKVPSYTDLVSLRDFLGGYEIAGGKLKETGSEHWEFPNGGATNVTGFTALPGGWCTPADNYPTFSDLGFFGLWWSTSKVYDNYDPYILLCEYDDTYLGIEDGPAEWGLSVRCIKDTIITEPKIPLIKTTSSVFVSIGDTFTIKGINFGIPTKNSFVSFKNIKATEIITWNDTLIKVIVPEKTIYGKVWVEIDGLESNKFDFIVTNECKGRSSYSSISIGTQVWMGENLDVCTYRNGDVILHVTDPAEWDRLKYLKIGAWCYYNNDSAIGSIYGKLYNYYAVTDPRGLAPEGWHVASNEEWSTLTEFLGGGSIAGGKVKQAGTTIWLPPNLGATNESGFTALPGGFLYEGWEFNEIGAYGLWWAATEYSDDSSWYWILDNNSAGISKDYQNKGDGLTVRCVKD